MQPAQQYSAERGDELSLIELWKVLVEYKLLIIVFTTLTTLGAIYYVSTLPTVYKTDVLMIPVNIGNTNGSLTKELGGLANIAGISLGGGSNYGIEAEQTLARLKTRSFLMRYIKERKLKPILFADEWNEKERQWINQEPTNHDASIFLLDMIDIEREMKDPSGLIIFSLEWKNPANLNMLASVANGLINESNVQAKQRAILEAKSAISFLEKELEKTNILNSKAILYSMVEQQMQQITLANIRDEFVFKVIDRAVKPRNPEPSHSKVIIFLGFLFGIIFGSIFAVYINKVRKV